jgi:hypothetical protein
MKFRLLAPLAILLLLVPGCKKEYDAPPVRQLPVGQVLTVAQLRDLFTGNTIQFSGDSSVYAVVTADEQNGNLYKNVFVQDHTGAIVMRLVNSGGLYQGDSIRIYLPGTILSIYNGLLQLDSVNVDNNVVKQATQVIKTPSLVTIAQLTATYNPTWSHPWQAKLIRLDSVEFITSELGQTYANAATQQTLNRNLSDCQGTVLVRNSGYANFAGQLLPTGNGSFVGVVGQFNNDMQLFIRDINEVQLTGERCDPLPELCPPVVSVQQDFGTLVNNVDVSLECWINQPQVGSRYWRGTSSSGNMCAQATAFQSTNATDITWLISPQVTFTPGMSLSFRSQRGFGQAGHDPFGLFISTNYDLSNLATANWAPLTSSYATPATADQVWVNSGAVDLGSALPPGYSGSFVVGFRYTGSGTTGQTTNFRIDDVVIQ